MAAQTQTMNPAQAEPAAGHNPALNPQTFGRAMAETPAAERQGMTATGAYVKTGFLLIILVFAAAFGWSQVEVVTVNGHQVAIQPPWTWLAFMVTFILALTAVLAIRLIPIISIIYAIAEGALLGVASHYFNLEWDGIVLQAVVATLCVFTVTLLLYLTGIVRVTSRLALGVAIGLGGLALLYMTAWLFSLVGIYFSFLNSPTPLGILFSLGVVLLGALNLPLDFEFIRRASAAGAPRFMEWFGAYGLMLSIIWMYVSILRLLALLRGR